MQLVEHVASVTLPHTAESPGAARAFVRAVLADRFDDDLVSSAEVCVTELVTNAVLHAHTALTVEVELIDHTVRISVQDGSAVLPRVVPHTRSAVTGRGLGLVTALSRDWGVERQPGGKVVWCVLEPTGLATELDEDELLAQWEDFDGDVVEDPHERTDDVAAHAAVATAGDSEHAPVTVIRLLGYPVRRGVRLREHREAVLRECQLLLLAGEVDGHHLTRRLVQMSNVLSAHYGAELSEPEQTKIHALLHGAETIDLNYPVRPESLSTALAWRDLLDEIDRFCSEAGLLTLATPPDLDELTRWILDEFIRQLNGQPPRGWSGSLD